MRRKDREITEKTDLLEILNECKVFNVATQDENGLYIIPLNFGYVLCDNHLTLYFHSAKEGRKIDAFRKNSNVAFEMDCDHQLIEDSIPCKYGYKFRSIVGNGVVSEITDLDEKKKALSVLMKHQSGKDFIFDNSIENAIAVYKISATSYSGKQKI